MKKLLLLMAVAWTVQFNLIQAQSAGNQESAPIRCYTTEYEAQRHKANPNLPTDQQFESWMAHEIAKLPQQSGPRATRVIPTVVHVIYSNATENISTAQVLSQIDVLNEDFQRLNPDVGNTPSSFLPVAANCDVEFCLATIDPNGNPTNGIDRISMSGSPFSTNTVDNTIKPATIWNPNNYFNLWVCNVSGGILGWAQFPEAAGLAGIGTGNGGANTDGVVCLYSSIGRPPANPFGGAYNGGRTATHEVGHWLGLRHIWGDGGCSVDDFCADTPTSDAANFGCPTTHVSCSTTDMVQNYMDYTDDNCMNIFTANQKSRIDVVLGSSIRRASLLTSTTCDVSPVISFQTTSTTATENSSGGTSGCRGYQDYNITLVIGGPPTGNATVTLTTVSGTLTPNVDYSVLTGSVVFPTGSTSSRNFVIRLFDDGSIEPTENLTIGFTISGTTDATAGTPNQHTITLNDNDVDPALGSNFTLLNEDFESGGAGWTLINNGGINQWVIGGTLGSMNGNRSSYITRNTTGQTYRRSETSSSRLRSPLINAVGMTGLNLSFVWHSGGETGRDFGSLAYSFDGITFTTFQTPFLNQTTNTTYTGTLPVAVENTNFYLGFQWVNDNNNQGTQPPFAIDDVSITAAAPIPVETTLNSLDAQYLGPNSTVYWYDNVSGDLMVRIDNPTAWDYGCTSVQIDRAGTGATLYETSNTPYSLTDKTFLITPTNNNSAGQYSIRLYYTSAEIGGWESVTSQLRGNINVAKTGGPISNITPSTPTANGPTNYFGTSTSTGTYNTTEFWVQADFSTGFSGFAAGIQDPNPLPLDFLEFSAEWSNRDALLTWQVANSKDLDYFTLEKSLDGKQFEVLHKMQVSNGKASYSYLDYDAGLSESPELFYRIRSHDPDGHTNLSETKRLQISRGPSISVHPNPFNESFNLTLSINFPMTIQGEILNNLGQVVSWEKLDLESGVFQQNLGQNLKPGIYFIRLQSGSWNQTLKLVKM
ncbi:MAG: T9SS type A sorting domain-containing protein [Bacteroidia bacterium]|nr:T9SS type A sorting domain-containing protein [Bacteroidia bacterium]